MTVEGLIVTVAVCVTLVCAWAAAVIVTIFLVGTVDGAVYRPVTASIVPFVASPVRLQVTAVLLRPEALPVNCTCPLTVTVQAIPHATELTVPETVTEGGVGVVVLEPPPPQEFRANAGRRAKTRRKRYHRISWRHM
jgi:hypothetical protein